MEIAITLTDSQWIAALGALQVSLKDAEAQATRAFNSDGRGLKRLAIASRIMATAHAKIVDHLADAGVMTMEAKRLAGSAAIARIINNAKAGNCPGCGAADVTTCTCDDEPDNRPCPGCGQKGVIECTCGR